MVSPVYCLSFVSQLSITPIYDNSSVLSVLLRVTAFYYPYIWYLQCIVCPSSCHSFLLPLYMVSPVYCLSFFVSQLSITPIYGFSSVLSVLLRVTDYPYIWYLQCIVCPFSCHRLPLYMVSSNFSKVVFPSAKTNLGLTRYRAEVPVDFQAWTRIFKSKGGWVFDYMWSWRSYRFPNIASYFFVQSLVWVYNYTWSWGSHEQSTFNFSLQLTLSEEKCIIPYELHVNLQLIFERRMKHIALYGSENWSFSIIPKIKQIRTLYNIS